MGGYFNIGCISTENGKMIYFKQTFKLFYKITDKEDYEMLLKKYLSFNGNPVHYRADI